MILTTGSAGFIGDAELVGGLLAQHRSLAKDDDPALAIAWKLDSEPAFSAKDMQGKTLAEAELFA